MSIGFSHKEIGGTVLLNGWSPKVDYSGQRVWSETGEAVTVCIIGKEGCCLFSWARRGRVWKGAGEGRLKTKNKKGLSNRKYNMWLKTIRPKVI